MRKILIMATLFAVACSVQADNLVWYADGNSGNTWGASTANWLALDDNLAPVPTHFPTAGDAVFIESDLTSLGMTGLPVVAPVVGSTATAAALGMAWFDASSQLTIATGGSLSVGGFTRLGNAIDSLATLDMTGGYMISSDLQVGYNETTNGLPSGAVSGGSGVVNMSGDAILHAGILSLGQERIDYDAGNPDLDGTGVINMTDSVRFLVNGDVTVAAANWVASGWIKASGAGESITYGYDGVNDRTEFNVVPEPATLGLFAMIGGGMVWIRRCFRI